MNTRSKMRNFQLVRDEDASGVSGTGLVAEGVEFSSGMVAVTWLSQFSAVNVYANMRVVEELHGHDGKTRIVFTSPPAPKKIDSALPDPSRPRPGDVFYSKGGRREILSWPARDTVGVSCRVRQWLTPKAEGSTWNQTVRLSTIRDFYKPEPE